MERSQCPKCAEKGADTRGDNLITFADKHQHCFACHYHVGIPKLEKLRAERNQDFISPIEVNPQNLNFPEDYSLELPYTVKTYLRKYHIYDEQLAKHKIGWSMAENLLIFPFFDGEGNLLAWQGRSFFRPKQPKYISYGPIRSIYPFCGKDAVNMNVVLVEDMLSAIRVGEVVTALPLFGTDIPLGLIKKLSAQYNSVGVWLDPDAVETALLAVLRASQYMPSYLITSMFDPKHYTQQDIHDILETSYPERLYGSLAPEITETEAAYLICKKLPYAEAAFRLRPKPLPLALYNSIRCRENNT